LSSFYLSGHLITAIIQFNSTVNNTNFWGVPAMDEGLLKAYMTSEVAAILSVSQSTVRNYSIALERHGYVIAKPKRSRMFVEQDIATLMRMKELRASSKLPLNDIAGMMGTIPIAPPSEISDVEVQNNTAMNELLAAIMDEFNAMKKENADLKKEIKRNMDHINVIIHEVRRTNSILFKALSDQSDQPEQKRRRLFWKMK
jgi:DNA-binding transcriptional MerR regulator